MQKNPNPIHHYTRRLDRNEILNSSFFKQAGDRARDYLRNPRKAARVIGDALHKSVDLGKEGAFSELKEGVQVLGRMLNTILKGEYKRLPLKTLVRILAGLIYFLFLVDFIPDFIPLLGLMDDAVVIAWVINGIRDELDDYLAWEGQLQ
jgi:uncharacterized membrane protein YkvA (DUF1232 family)